MTRSTIVALLVGVVLGACVHSDSVTCSPDLICPDGTQCDVMDHACVVPEQTTACNGIAEGMLCTWPGGAGECVHGFCLPNVCGDGRRSGPERCDPSDPTAMMTTCDSVELGYYESTPVSCAPDCQWDVSACSTRCGDGALNGNELCEEGISPNRTCLDYGFDRGTLGCAACAPGFDDCHLIGWTRGVLPGTPGAGVAVGDDVFVALPAVGLADLAVHLDHGVWFGMGTQPGIEVRAQPTAIAATAPTDVWVGGMTGAMSGDLGFVSRWDGTAWTRIRTFPLAVSAMWAHDTHVFVITGLDVFVYDGTTWTTQTFATSGTQFWISGSSSDDVWIGGGKLFHGGSALGFAEVTLPVVAGSTVSGVSAFAADQVAVAVFEPTPAPGRLTLYVRESGAWRAAPWLAQGTKQGFPVARSATNIYMLVNDLSAGSASRIAHHDGTSWVTLTESSMTPTTIAGSATSLVAFEHDQLVAWHYEGSAWVSFQPYATTEQVYGPRHDTVFATANNMFRQLTRFDGAVWALESFARGRAAAIPNGPMYSADSNLFGTPRIWPWVAATSMWGNHIDPPLANGELAEWIGVLGTGDVFLKQLVGGATAHYIHWPGTTNPVTLETTNLPDGIVLDKIECRPGTGCYAASSTDLWFTAGDRNSWTQVTPPAVGTLNVITVGDAGFAAIGGTQGRIARTDGASWTVDQLPTASAVTLLVAASPNDMFALAESSSASEVHELFHWDGTSWSRIRTPVPAAGSKIRQLWTDGRVTYFGSGVSPGHFHALVRTEPW